MDKKAIAQIVRSDSHVAVLGPRLFACNVSHYSRAERAKARRFFSMVVVVVAVMLCMQWVSYMCEWGLV